MEIEKTLQTLESMKRSRVLASVLNHTDHEALSNAIAIIKAAKEAHEHLSHLKDADFQEVKGVAHRRAFTAYDLLADALLSPSTVSEGEPNK